MSFPTGIGIVADLIALATFVRQIAVWLFKKTFRNRFCTAKDPDIAGSKLMSA